MLLKEAWTLNLQWHKNRRRNLTGNEWNNVTLRSPRDLISRLLSTSSICHNQGLLGIRHLRDLHLRVRQLFICCRLNFIVEMNHQQEELLFSFLKAVNVGPCAGDLLKSAVKVWISFRHQLSTSIIMENQTLNCVEVRCIRSDERCSALEID